MVKVVGAIVLAFFLMIGADMLFWQYLPHALWFRVLEYVGFVYLLLKASK